MPASATLITRGGNVSGSGKELLPELLPTRHRWQAEDRKTPRREAAARTARKAYQLRAARSFLPRCLRCRCRAAGGVAARPFYDYRATFFGARWLLRVRALLRRRTSCPGAFTLAGIKHSSMAPYWCAFFICGATSGITYSACATLFSTTPSSARRQHIASPSSSCSQLPASASISPA